MTDLSFFRLTLTAEANPVTPARFYFFDGQDVLTKSLSARVAQATACPLALAQRLVGSTLDGQKNNTSMAGAAGDLPTLLASRRLSIETGGCGSSAKARVSGCERLSLE